MLLRKVLILFLIIWKTSLYLGRDTKIIVLTAKVGNWGIPLVSFQKMALHGVTYIYLLCGIFVDKFNLIYIGDLDAMGLTKKYILGSTTR